MVILEAMALFEVIQGEEKYGREGGYEWLRREEEWGCREARWALGPFFAVQKRMRRYWEKKWERTELDDQRREGGTGERE